MQEIEKDLISKAGEGDMVAFHEIYQKASGFVYTLAFRITNRKYEAEEVTQDVFLKLYKSLKTFKFEASFKTWLYRVAVNTALNYVKKKKRMTSHEVEEEGNEAVFATPPEASRGLEEAEAAEKLQYLLDQLTPDHRACIVLREIEGLDYRTIAENLGININTVRSRLKRAREVLMVLGQKEVASHGM